MKTVIELGDEVKCKITGFRGIVTSYAKCLTGCDRITVQPPVKKDGKHPDSLWFDMAAVKIIKKGKVKASSVQEQVAPFGEVQKRGGGPTKVARRGVI